LVSFFLNIICWIKVFARWLCFTVLYNIF
jgi:hypothetical protein